MPRSKFDRDTIREYFEFCQRTGRKRVNSLEGLTKHACETGSNDDEIKAWLFPPDDTPQVVCPTCAGTGRVPEPAAPPAPGCHLCCGAGRLNRYDPMTDRDELWPCPSCQQEEFDKKAAEAGAFTKPSLRLPSAAASGFSGLAGLEIVTERDASGASEGETGLDAF